MLKETIKNFLLKTLSDRLYNCMMTPYRKIRLLTIRCYIFFKIEFFKSCGVSIDAFEYVVALTSFPERIYMKNMPVQQTVYSLLSQNFRPWKVILYLSEEEFPRRERQLPHSLKSLKKNGLEIHFCPRNMRSYKKLLPALSEYPDKTIITADDDILYPQDWLSRLILAAQKYPQQIVAHRGRRIKVCNGKISPYEEWTLEDFSEYSKLNLPTGAGGILYPPHIFHHDIYNYSIAQKLAPYADDLFFWAMAVLKGNAPVAVKNGYNNVIPLIDDFINTTNLYAINGLQKQNDVQFAALLRHYPQLKKIILDSSDNEIISK